MPDSHRIELPLDLPDEEFRYPKPGTWRPFIDSGQRTAFVTCGACGAWTSLRAHSIATDGTVEPELVCSGCGTKEAVRLVGWPCEGWPLG